MVDILPNNSPALSTTSDMPGNNPTVDPVATDTVPVTTPVVDPTPIVPIADPVTPKEPIGVRISELTRQRREADERAARFENLVTQQNESLTRALEALSKINTAKPDPIPDDNNNITSFTSPRPNRDNFSDAESYELALVSWASSEAASRATMEMERKQREIEADRIARDNEAKLAQEEESRRAKENENIATIESSWKTRQEEAASKYEDFYDIVKNSNIPISDPMAFVIKTSDDGAELAYYLGKHPEEAAKIASMIIPNQVYPAGQWNAGYPVADALKQAVALGKLAAKLGLGIDIAPSTVEASVNSLAIANTTEAPTNTPVPVTPSVSTPPAIVLAPAPVNPITGANANATSNDPSNMSMEEYARMRLPQLQAERRPGRSLN